MSANTNTKTSACQQADHYISALAIIWTFQVGHPKWGEKFASLLDHRLREMLPEGCLREILQGQESEIRQGSALMLLHRFLHGNKQLQQATEQEDLAEVANQIQRSICAALRLSNRRVLRSLQRDRRRFTLFDENAECYQLMHPAYREKVCELPFEAQRSLLLILLVEGVRARSISPANSKMIQRMVDKAMNQVDAAAELSVSRQAVNQRISIVGAAVRAKLEETEFPTLIEA